MILGFHYRPSYASWVNLKLVSSQLHEPCGSLAGNPMAIRQITTVTSRSSVERRVRAGEFIWCWRLSESFGDSRPEVDSGLGCRDYHRRDWSFKFLTLLGPRSTHDNFGEMVMARVRIEETCADYVQTGSGCWVDCEASPSAGGSLKKESSFREEKGMLLDQMVVK
jgi:hypothetical protein